MDTRSESWVLVLITMVTEGLGCPPPTIPPNMHSNQTVLHGCQDRHETLSQPWVLHML